MKRSTTILLLAALNDFLSTMMDVTMSSSRLVAPGLHENTREGCTVVDPLTTTGIIMWGGTGVWCTTDCQSRPHCTESHPCQTENET